MEGQGRGIIMEVTRPLLLEPFHLVKWPVNPNILAASVAVVSDQLSSVALVIKTDANCSAILQHSATI